MKSEPVKASRLISPLKTPIPTMAERQRASALRSSDPSPVTAEFVVCAAFATAIAPGVPFLMGVLFKGGSVKLLCWVKARHAYRLKMTIRQRLSVAARQNRRRSIDSRESTKPGNLLAPGSVAVSVDRGTDQWQSQSQFLFIARSVSDEAIQLSASRRTSFPSCPGLSRASAS